MPMAQLNDLATEDAETYRDAVIAREPGRLGELSGWVQGTGGPWDELDASVESLRPLWAWFMGFVADRCPGIPVGTAVQGWILAEDEDVPPLLRIGYGLEAMEHYVMLVCRRVDPAATWVMDRHQQSTDFHETGIELSNGVWFSPASVLGSMASRVIGQRDQAAALLSDRNDLRRVIRLWLGDLAPATQDQRPPVLPPPRPTPDPPSVLWRPTHPAAGGPVPARLIWARTAEDDMLANLLSSSEDLIILRGPGTGLHNPRLLDALDSDLITAHLREHGFTAVETKDKDGKHTQAWDLETDLINIYAAVVSLDDGAPRHIVVSFEGDTDFRAPGFRAAATIFITLAQRLNARLTNSDDIREEVDHDDD